jgi:hypothetical protein
MPPYQSLIPSRTLGSGDTVYLFGIPNTAAAISASPAGAVRNAGIVTITTGAAHNFVPGQQVDIKGVGSVGGFSGVYGFDGSYTIQTVPSTTTFTYFDPQKPNDTGGGGNAISVAAEQPAALPANSAQVNILQNRGTTGAANVRFEGIWTGTPGAFEVDLQSASSDIDSEYVMNTVTTATKVTTDAADVNAINTFTVDLSATPGVFMRARILSRANGVGLVLKATGAA